MFRNTATTDDDSSPLRRMDETRWQSFRALNRNRPLKQARTILGAVLCITAYSYSLLSCSFPNYNYHQVLEFNAIQRTESIKLHQEKLLESAKRRAERQEALRLKREARKQRKAAEVAEQNATTTTLLRSNNSTVTESTPENAMKQHGPFYRFLNFISSLTAFFTIICLVRSILRLCLFSQGITVVSRTTTGSRTRAQQQRQARQSRFRAWVRNLNRQRLQQGERPLSVESLRLVLRERELNSNDYDGLLNFSEESGPAMEALLRGMGATAEEINRCPQRTLERGDDLLKPTSRQHVMPSCAVCLEVYQPQDVVRTIPCFHTFHTRCIDPWLSQKAQCPVCKHPAVA